MKEVPLSNSALKALVDDCDLAAAQEFKWAARRGRRAGTWYAQNTSSQGPRLLHALIAARAGMAGAFIDHENRDGLDNQRANLRAATRAQNGWNAERKCGASGFPGVHRNRNGWAVRFDHEGRTLYFGTHSDIEVAKRIAARELVKLRGEFLPVEVRSRIAILESEPLQWMAAQMGCELVVRDSRAAEVAALTARLRELERAA